MSRATDLASLLGAIERAGGIGPHVDAQLAERGFLVARRDVDAMSDREHEAYKKQIKEEAARREELKREARRAYRDRHVVHLGEGIHCDDRATRDPWDIPDAEERAAENDLPPLDSPRDLAEALGLTVAQVRWLAYTATSRRCSTTAASRSPSATARSGRSGRRCRRSRPPGTGSSATSPRAGPAPPRRRPPPSGSPAWPASSS